MNELLIGAGDAFVWGQTGQGIRSVTLKIKEDQVRIIECPSNVWLTIVNETGKILRVITE